MAMGHIGLLGALMTSVRSMRPLHPFAALGRTALSLYIAQTLLCLWLLYPPFELGLFGQQGWAGLMLSVAAINLGLLLVANWYVRTFTIAPVEWAWRSLAAGRGLPSTVSRRGRFSPLSLSSAGLVQAARSRQSVCNGSSAVPFLKDHHAPVLPFGRGGLCPPARIEPCRIR